MNEFSVPPCYLSDPNDNLTDDIFDHAEHWPEQDGFSRRVGERWVPVTYREAAEQVTRMAAGADHDEIGLVRQLQQHAGSLALAHLGTEHDRRRVTYPVDGTRQA